MFVKIEFELEKTQADTKINNLGDLKKKKRIQNLQIHSLKYINFNNESSD